MHVQKTGEYLLEGGDDVTVVSLHTAPTLVGAEVDEEGWSVERAENPRVLHGLVEEGIAHRHVGDKTALLDRALAFIRRVVATIHHLEPTNMTAIDARIVPIAQRPPPGASPRRRESATPHPPAGVDARRRAVRRGGRGPGPVVRGGRSRLPGWRLADGLPRQLQTSAATLRA